MTTKRMIAASEKMAILNEGMQPGAVVTEHDILQGSGRISRHKEHFDGLLKTIKEQNLQHYSDVEKRDLSVYDSAGGE